MEIFHDQMCSTIVDKSFKVEIAILFKSYSMHTVPRSYIHIVIAADVSNNFAEKVQALIFCHSFFSNLL